MAAKSLRKIDLLANTDSILVAIQEAREPLTITDIARVTGLSVDTVFRQIGTMVDLRWVERIGDGHVLGMRLAVLWAKKKSLLETRLDKIQRELNELSGGQNG